MQQNATTKKMVNMTKLQLCEHRSVIVTQILKVFAPSLSRFSIFLNYFLIHVCFVILISRSLIRKGKSSCHVLISHFY